MQNNWKYKIDYKNYYDSKVKVINYKVGDFVYLHSPEMLKINKKIQSPFLGPFLVQERINEHNYIIQNLKTHRTKLIHVDRLRLAKPDPNSIHLGQNAGNSSNVKSRLQAKQTAGSDNSRSENKNSLQNSSQLVEFDLKNDVTWLSGDPMPAPIPLPIKDEIPDQNLAVEQQLEPEVDPSIRTSPSPETSSKSSTSKFPSPAKIGQEFLNVFSKRATRAATKQEGIVLPAAAAPPPVCPSKSKTLQTQTRKKTIQKETKK